MRDFDTIQLALTQLKSGTPNWIATLQAAERHVPDANVVYFISDSEPIAVPKSVMPSWNLCAVGIGLKRETLLQLSPNFIILPSPSALADLGVTPVTATTTVPVTTGTVTGVATTPAGPVGSRFATVIGHIYMNNQLREKVETRKRLASARGYAGIVVTLVDSANKRHVTKSDKLGEFHLDNVAPGNAYVNFTIPPGFICLLGNLSGTVNLQTSGVNRIPPLEIAMEKSINKVAAPLTDNDVIVIVVVSIVGGIAILAIVACCIWRGKRTGVSPLDAQIRAPIQHAPQLPHVISHGHHGIKVKQRND